MKRTLFGVAIAVLAAAASQVAFGQHGGNPFIDHSDTGQTVHVLPAPAALQNPHFSQPTDAPARNGVTVYQASYGSGNLVNHGGGQIPNAQFFQIYWNGTVANARGTSLGWQSLQAEIDAFIHNFSDGGPYSSASGTGDYTIVTQYGTGSTPISVSLSSGGAYVDSQPTAKSISDSKIQSYLAGFFQRNLAVPSSSVIYGIYFPSGMKISLQGGTSCSAFCGYHGQFNYNGTDIKYAVFPYTDCRACSMPGKAVADILTMVTSHEIREAVTDPDLNAWYDSAGYEADDKCAWHNLYQMHRTAPNNFWVQPEYSNGGSGYPGPGCVVP